MSGILFLVICHAYLACQRAYGVDVVFCDVYTRVIVIWAVIIGSAELKTLTAPLSTCFPSKVHPTTTQPR